MNEEMCARQAVDSQRRAWALPSGRAGARVLVAKLLLGLEGGVGRGESCNLRNQAAEWQGWC